MRHIVRRTLALLGLVGFACMAVAATAFAMDTCHGELSASPLRPLPFPAVIGIDMSDNSPENATLAAAFTRGMSNAGAQVPGSNAATVKLRLSWQVLGSGGGGGGGAQGGGGQGAQDFPQAGIDRQAPVIPNQNLFPRGQTLQPGLLVFRAEARDPTGATIFWIGSIECTLRGGENETLLYQLGQVIGGAIGQRRDHTAI
jgi:hypothetical protein